MDRSKKMLIGGVAAVVVIVVIAVVAWPKGSSVCVPSSTKPDMATLAAKNVASADLTALASLVGYVTLETTNGNKTESSYLPADLTSVQVLKTDTGNTVRLSGECIMLDVKYKVVNNSYAYEKIDLKLTTHPKKDHSYEIACDFEKQLSGTQPKNLRYSCVEEQSHRCKPSDLKETTHTLNLKAFEFEIDDQQIDVKNGKFVKDKFEQSCKSWPV